MHRLGISVYPDKCNRQELTNYLKFAASLGYSRIFTCFLSIDMSRETKSFLDFSTLCHQLGFELAIDVNQTTFTKLQATPDNLVPFKELGVDIIRLDGDFGISDDVAIINNDCNLKIEFNASMNSKIDRLIEAGANCENILACHNFYPQLYTGLDFDHFSQLNKQLNQLNIPIAAFVSSQNNSTIGPWQATHGLPTLEIHRNLPIEVQAQHLIATNQINDIIIGNYPASKQELVALSNVNFDCNVLAVTINENISPIEREILCNYYPHRDRPDFSSYLVRSSLPRIKYQKHSIFPLANQPTHYHPGDILIVNDNLAHYRGELQLVLKTIKNPGYYNLVATVNSDNHILLSHLRRKQPFIFYQKR